MWFWIFMLCIDLLTPLLMVGFGKYFFKHTSKDINEIFGYRTAMSMKNKDTWVFAHTYCGKLWYVGAFAIAYFVIGYACGYRKNREYYRNCRCCFMLRTAYLTCRCHHTY